jgi:hypothetical protein
MASAALITWMYEFNSQSSSIFIADPLKDLHPFYLTSVRWSNIFLFCFVRSASGDAARDPVPALRRPLRRPRASGPRAPGRRGPGRAGAAGRWRAGFKKRHAIFDCLPSSRPACPRPPPPPHLGASGHLRYHGVVTCKMIDDTVTVPSPRLCWRHRVVAAAGAPAPGTGSNSRQLPSRAWAITPAQDSLLAAWWHEGTRRFVAGSTTPRARLIRCGGSLRSQVAPTRPTDSRCRRSRARCVGLTGPVGQRPREQRHRAALRSWLALSMRCCTGWPMNDANKCTWVSAA